MKLPADIQAMAVRPEPTPAPAGPRLEGLVEKWTGNYGIIRSKMWECMTVPSEVEPDEIGRRFLVEQEPVTFTPVSDPKRATASDVRPVFRERIDPKVHRETVVLTSWNPDRRFGFARRELGGPLYVSARAVISEGVDSLKVGSRLWCGVQPPWVEGKAWAATNVEIYEDEAQS